MLAIQTAIDALLPLLDRSVAAFARLARRHRETPVVARTWLQHAQPMPGTLAALGDKGLLVAEKLALALGLPLPEAPWHTHRAAHHLVEVASKKAAAEELHLRNVLASDPKVTAQLDPDRIAEHFEPGSYQGVSQALIDRLLASLEGRYVT
jgi:3-carboxy-cis,cis-muconate cycloisomerase